MENERDRKYRKKSNLNKSTNSENNKSKINNSKLKSNKIKDINEYKKSKKNKHKKRKSKLAKNATIVFKAVCVLSIVIINICGYVTMSKLKYEIGDLKKDLRKQEIILEEVKAVVDTNTSIQEIESQAKEKLNMDYPKENQIRYISVEN